MDYHLGQFVACIDENWQYNVPGQVPVGVTLPRKGTIYRIRSRILLRSDLFLLFDEIRNPAQPSPAGPHEPVFDARSFLPLDPKRLDVFRQQLAPVDLVPA